MGAAARITVAAPIHFSIRDVRDIISASHAKFIPLCT
jgi:hypothetical protein